VLPTRDLPLAGVAVAVGAAVALTPGGAIAACVVVALAAVVWVRPATAAYLVMGVTPLVVGIERGVALPVLRPNEALELFLGAVLVFRGLCGIRSGGIRIPHPSRVEWSLLMLLVTTSVFPLATMGLRGREITADDVLSAFVLWKLVGIYLIVRWSVRSNEQVRRCLYVSLAAATVVAAVGLLQSLDLVGVRQLLAAHYAPFGNARSILVSARGGSTLSLPAATADLMVMNLAVVTGLWVAEHQRRALMACLAALFVFATLAAGEFSSAIGLVVGVVTLVIITASVRLLTVFGVFAAAGCFAVWPVINRRLQDFQSASGLPVSWIGRLHNLRTYFWPHLHSYANVLVGVRPSARVRVDTQATGWVWIESGYTWLLWAGGVPLLLSFLFFVYATITQGWRVARRGVDATGVAATAAVVGVVVVSVLMTFDPHLTYRGSGDELFALIALTTVTAHRRPGSAVGDAEISSRPDTGRRHTGQQQLGRRSEP
jgi:hypothetical protein